jgi:chemotaxis protein MotB
MARMHKKHKHVAHENHERYLITYADMITLLLVFFIVLFAISNADKEKYIKLSTGLSEAFTDNVNVLAGQYDYEGSAPSIEADPRFSTFLAVRGQIAQMTQRMQLREDQLSVEMSTDGIVIHLSDEVLFPPGTIELRPEGAAILDEIAAIVGPLPNETRVEGHTDNVAPEGDVARDNWDLSVLRAVSCVEYLTTVHQIEPARMSAAGYGEFRPLGDNTTIEGRRQNRRVDFLIVERNIMSLQQEAPEEVPTEPSLFTVTEP